MRHGVAVDAERREREPVSHTSGSRCSSRCSSFVCISGYRTQGADSDPQRVLPRHAEQGRLGRGARGRVLDHVFDVLDAFSDGARGGLAALHVLRHALRGREEDAAPVRCAGGDGRVCEAADGRGAEHDGRGGAFPGGRWGR